MLLARLAALFAVATLVKVLLLAADLYRSTDFEVHRNWLAITYSLPPKRWYFNEGSEWTLDYPPFFAWLERLLSLLAVRVDSAMVELESFNYASRAAVIFQKGTVIVLDTALPLGVASCFWASFEHRDVRSGGRGAMAGDGTPAATAAAALVLLDGGLLLVDHVHFQYNGFLLGLLLLSLGLARQQGREVAAAAVFATLLLFKHLFLSLAPLYFVYILRRYCWHDDNSGWGLRPVRLTMQGAVVAVTLALALGPLCVPAIDGAAADTGTPAGRGDVAAAMPDCADQLRQLAVQLFPFGRGLTHAYWAPNFWALYLTADRVLLVAAKRLGLAGMAPAGSASTTGGLVHAAGTAVLPSVTPAVAAVLVLAAGAPALNAAWRRRTPQVFLWGVVYCSLCAFMLGWHVHEKAILVSTVPLALLAPEGPAEARLYLRLCAAGYFALLPLFPRAQETPTKTFVYLSHLCLAWELLRPVL
ncbi:unnamed protein product, partial [Phaeothamnion confervicola]